jgi:hypothetical protein
MEKKERAEMWREEKRVINSRVRKGMGLIEKQEKEKKALEKE